MKLSAIIIDDDQHSRAILRSFIIDDYPGISIAGEAGSVSAAQSLIKRLKPELLLLDISLPDGTAFDLLSKLTEREFEVIFITAYDHFAVNAFKYAAIDYLLKPVSFTELGDALTRAQMKAKDKYFREHYAVLSHNLNVPDLYERRLAVASGNKYFFIPLGSISYLESQSNYTHFTLADGKKLISSYTLGYYEDILPAEKFIRIHHSCIVNVISVDCYIKEGAGGTVVMKDGKKLAVSQRKKEEVVSRLIPKT